jgi:hypothetical protein
MLWEAFPKRLAMAFSGLCNQAFPPISRSSVVDLSKRLATVVIITGESWNWHRKIISCMFSCCRDRGMQRFPYFYHCRFWNYTCALEAAEALQIDVLCHELWGRLEGIAKLQVHTHDIRALYSSSERGYPMRKVVSDSIGKALLEGYPRAQPCYIDLIQDLQFEDFCDDVVEAIRCLEQANAESVEGKAAEAAKETLRAAVEQANEEHHESPSGSPQEMNNDDVADQLATPVETITSEDGSLSVEVLPEAMRNGQKKHGRYVVPPLRRAGMAAETHQPLPNPEPYHDVATKSNANRISSSALSASLGVGIFHISAAVTSGSPATGTSNPEVQSIGARIFLLVGSLLNTFLCSIPTLVQSGWTPTVSGRILANSLRRYH